MVEMLEAYDKNGTLIKIQERKSLLKEIREYSDKYGDANFAVPLFHLILINPKGQLYILQRANNAENSYMFDKTVGGHVRAGEKYEEALFREADEEAGVQILLVESKNYEKIVRTTNLKKKAVVHAVDFNPWSKSIRFAKDGKLWIKRNRVMTYIGMYDGKINYKDGEAISKILVTPEELKLMIKKDIDKFTFDLQAILENYKKYLKPVN